MDPHTPWCQTMDHTDRIASERTTHPDTPGWTPCVSDVTGLTVAGLTLTGMLIEDDDGSVSAVIEASRDGRVVPAAFKLSLADAATARAWVSGLFGFSALPVAV